MDGIVGFTLKLSDTIIYEYTYKKNIQGDIIGIYDSNNVLICKYIYDAWGNHKTLILSNNGEYVDISSTSDYTNINNNYIFIANLNPFRYRGYYFDTDTGLYYLNSRYYDPELGRFINADAIDNIDTENLNGFNLYMYCADNPVNMIDENGNMPKWLKWLAVAVGAVLVVAAVATLVVTSGGSALGLVGTIAVGAAKGALIGAAVGTAVGAGIGYAVGGIEGMWDGMALGFGVGALIGAIAGGTVAVITYNPIAPSGLSKISINKGVKIAMKDPNKINHIVSKNMHHLGNLSKRELSNLMKNTLWNGQISSSGSAQIASWIVKGSNVRFVIVDKIVRIGTMWLL